MPRRACFRPSRSSSCFTNQNPEKWPLILASTTSVSAYAIAKPSSRPAGSHGCAQTSAAMRVAVSQGLVRRAALPPRLRAAPAIAARSAMRRSGTPDP